MTDNPATGTPASTATQTEPGGRRWALARYVFAATLVRSADGGAVVAIVLLAHAAGLPGWVSGLLGASITAPHLLGPFIARRLDTTPDGRTVIAVCAVAHGVLLGVAALLLPVTWVIWPALLLVVSGLFGPMLTGGVSSRLPSIAGDDPPPPPPVTTCRSAYSWRPAGSPSPRSCTSRRCWSRSVPSATSARRSNSPGARPGLLFTHPGTFSCVLTAR